MLTGEGSQGHININIRGKVFAMLLEMKPIFLPSKRQHDVDLSLLIFCLSTHGKVYKQLISTGESNVPGCMYACLHCEC